MCGIFARICSSLNALAWSRLHYKKGRIETRIDASNDETLMPRSDVVGYGPSSAKATGTAWERLQKSGMTQYYDGSGW